MKSYYHMVKMTQKNGRSQKINVSRALLGKIVDIINGTTRLLPP